MPSLDWWRTTVVLVPAIAAYTIVFGTASVIAAAIDRRGHLSHRCAQLWARLILGTSGVRVSTMGSMPPPSDSCIFVVNHSSIYDMPVLFSTIPHSLRIMAKSALGYVPFIGWHLHLSGHVLVNRRRPGAAIFKRMLRMTRHHASLVVFPEGGRTRDGLVGAFKPGIFLLAIESRLPVVPLTMIGNRQVMPRGRFAVAPGPVRLVVHPAIATAALTRADARALAEQVRRVVASAL